MFNQMNIPGILNREKKEDKEKARQREAALPATPQYRPPHSYFDPGDPKKIFELLEKIGSGSYGDVYKAKMLTNNQIAAVKVIALEPGENLQDVMTEVQMLKDCHHENIVSYFGCFFKQGQANGQNSIWIAMEYCGGGSIEAIYKACGKPFSENEIACVLKDCIQGIAYLHETRKIHRDIKGGNLLLSEDGVVKLADFGVSAQLTRTLKKRQTVIGSPYWMAPEVITAEDFHTHYDEKADIWSIGITAIEMAELAPPLYDLHPMRALFMIPKNKAPTLSKKSKWSKEFSDFIAQTINKNLKKRADAQQLLQHPFIAGAKNQKQTIIEIIERWRAAKAKGTQPPTEEADSDNEEQSNASASTSPNNNPNNPSPSNASILATVNSVSQLQFNRSNTESSSQLPPELQDFPPDFPANEALSVFMGAAASPAPYNPSPQDQEAEENLLAMGFQKDLVRESIRLFGTDLEKAANWIITQTSEEVSRDSALARQLSDSMRVTHHERPHVSQMESDEEYARRLEQEYSNSRRIVKPVISAPRESFRAQKLCRVRKTINCGDYWEREQSLLLGVESLLVSIKAEEDGKQKLSEVSDRSYLKVQIIEEIGLMVSISGKKEGSICISDLNGYELNKKGQKKFEAETKLKKLKDSKGAEFFKIERIGRAIYLLVCKSTSILVTKWAEHPFNKFMNVRELVIEGGFVSVGLHECASSEPRIIVGSGNGFLYFDPETEILNPYNLDHFGNVQKGKPIASLSLQGGNVLLCFEEIGLPITSTGEQALRAFQWRAPITHAISLGDTSLVTLCTDFCVDIWSSTSSLRLHTFNNTSRIFPLRLDKNNRVLFASMEIKQDMPVTSVISITSEK